MSDLVLPGLLARTEDEPEAPNDVAGLYLEHDFKRLTADELRALAKWATKASAEVDGAKSNHWEGCKTSEFKEFNRFGGYRCAECGAYE